MRVLQRHRPRGNVPTGRYSCQEVLPSLLPQVDPDSRDMGGLRGRLKVEPFDKPGSTPLLSFSTHPLKEEE